MPSSNRIRQVAIVVSACVAALMVAGVAASYLIVSGLCGHELYDSKTSPDGKVTATLLQVDCGATTGFGTWVLLSKTGKTPSKSRDRVATFIGFGGIEWVSNEELRLMTSQDLLNRRENLFGVRLSKFEEQGND